MCGIAGWVAFDHDLERDRATVDAMTATMARRGPDAVGTWIDRHVALGHRRLAIIDLEGGHQPMTVNTPTGTVALIYTGETYNFAELRDQLRHAGHEFRTRSDTEVVLRGYLEWGEALPEHLNGMFAFALWDGRRQTLMLVRDRLGIKPLYYHPTADGVLFGSEAKAILAHPQVQPTIDLDGLRELLTFVETPGHAVWAGMREVEPGSVVTVDGRGVQARAYWRLQAVPHTDPLDVTIGKIEDLLADIVRRQLVADVPRCTLLSGGLDSSALTAIAARELAAHGERVRSFSVAFGDDAARFVPDALRDTPDAPFVRDVATHVDSAHYDIVLDAAAIADLDIRRATVAARDLPAGLGDADSSLYLLFRAIRAHSTVALSGESADEVFGGYRWFHDPEAVQTDGFPWMAAYRERGIRSFLTADVRAALDPAAYVRDSYAQALAAVPRLPGESPSERRMREICYLHLTRLLGAMLERKDRLSMAVGLEVRVPFCDHRLVEYVFNTPWAMKTYDGREKSLLRGAVAAQLPRSVVERKKSPYPAIQAAVYVAALQRQVQAVLAERNHAVFDLFDRALIEQAVHTPAARVDPLQRSAFEWVLDVHTWLALRRPAIAMSSGQAA
jgi:asparagine synthase (glutamine-hydrolysing)